MKYIAFSITVPKLSLNPWSDSAHFRYTRDDLEVQLWLALSFMEDSKSFLSHGLTQSDTVRALVAIDANLTLASRDRFLSRLGPYLALWHRTTLRYLDFMSESVMLTLQEVIVASREDATHESTCQVANLELSHVGQTALLPAPPVGRGITAWCHTGPCPLCSGQSSIWTT